MQCELLDTVTLNFISDESSVFSSPLDSVFAGGTAFIFVGNETGTLQDLSNIVEQLGYGALPLHVTADISGDTGGTGTVPEPTTFALLGLALVGVAATRRRKLS